MNTRNKMYETNSKIRKWLGEKGYEDIHFFPHSRFSKDVHFRGLSFDGCCSYEKRFVLFQAKTNCKITKKLSEQFDIVSKESGVIMIWFNNIKRKGLSVNIFL